MRSLTRLKATGVGRIYGLLDPDTLELRYIGKTCNTPEMRLKAHLKYAEAGKKAHLFNWLRSLNKPPLLKVLKENIPLAELNQREQSMIKWHRSHGTRLTNTTAGGDGGATTTDKVWTEEEKLKHSIRLKGIPHIGTAEHNHLHPRIVKGTFKHSEETKRKLSLGRIGVKNPSLAEYNKSPEARRQRSEAAKKQWATMRDKMLESLKR